MGWAPRRMKSRRANKHIRYKSHLVLDDEGLARAIAEIAAEAIVGRTRRGQSATGGSLGTDLYRTGQLLRSVTTRRLKKGKRGKWRGIVGPDSKRHVGSAKKGGRKLSNIALGSILHFGVRGRMPPRPWVGLTRAQMRALLREVNRRGWLRERSGPPRRV